MKKRQVVVKKISSKPGSTSGSTTQRVRYVECQKNHAASIGGYAVDGCREFMAGGAEGGTVMCAACGCHRNFHRREVMSDGVSFEGNSST